MITHSLIQGTQAWHDYRATHLNASDAPAVLGQSSYTSRNQLIKQRATGIMPAVDATTQRRFDDGHRFEALARPLAEAIIGEELYPVTGSLGQYSASFDGLTMGEDIGFEHKSLNNTLRAAFDLIDTIAPEYRDRAGGLELPLEYQIQMEHQCMVGDCEKVLFMASKWDKSELVEERHCWYFPNIQLRKRIVDAWSQFENDVTAYQHVETPLPVVATVFESLPAVSVRLNGQLAVATNLPEFDVALRAFVKNIPANPSTDQEFADCESACKALKKAEDALTAAEDNAMAQVTDVETMRRLVGSLKTLARTTRLASEKVVTARKEAIRTEIVTGAKTKYASHVAYLNKRNGVSYLGVQYPDFAGAIKGKRSVDSLREAVDTLLANAKIEANATADRILTNISLSEVKEFDFLFADLPVLCLKETDDFAAIVATRLAEHLAKEAARIEAATAHIAEQERIKAEAAARQEEQAKVTLIPTTSEPQNLSPEPAEFKADTTIVHSPTSYMTGIGRRTSQSASARELVDDILNNLSESALQEVLQYLQTAFVRQAA